MLILRKRSNQTSERRRPFAYNACRMVKAKIAQNNIAQCRRVYLQIAHYQSGLARRFRRYLRDRMRRFFTDDVSARYVDSDELDGIVRREKQQIRLTIASLVDNALLRSEYRFRTQCQLRRLLECFHIPAVIIVEDGTRFSGEEALLIFLKMIMYPNQMNVVANKFHRNSSTPVSRISAWMENFFVSNWGYLITNNMRYWAPLLPRCTEVIRRKIEIQEGNGAVIVAVRDDPEAGFKISAMIDFSAIYTCAPGTGPVYIPGGAGAARVDPEGLQEQAAYSGYYAHHGLKVLSASLPNGMDFFVFFPNLLPTSETVALQNSGLLEAMEEEQALLGWNIRHTFHSDSNFINVHHPLLSSGGLTRIRIYQEHVFKDLKSTCKSLNNRTNLKMNVGTVARKVLASCILRNAYNCMNYGQVSVFFGMPPPSLESWTMQGPDALPLMNQHVHAIDNVLVNNDNA
jgi:hypothetical protein